MRLFRLILVFVALLALAFWVERGAAVELVPMWMSAAQHVIRACLAISFAMLLDGCIRAVFWNGYLTNVVGAKVPRLLPLLVSVIIYCSVLFNLLKHDYGISLGGALAASGVLAIVLGFALRSVILDLFTGLAVSVDRSYTVGDWVTISSRDLDEPVYGQVEDIDWRVTKLRREDGTLFVMPNSLGGVFSIVNHSQPHAPKRLEFDILLPHETPETRVEPLVTGAVLKSLMADGFAVEPAPQVLMTDINKDGVIYTIRFWVDIHIHRPTSATAHVRKAVHAAISQHGLAFPARKIDVRKKLGVGNGQENTYTDVSRTLSRASLFADVLDESEITALVARCRRRHIEKGETFIRQGDEGDSLFVILSGAADVMVDGVNGGAPLAVLTISDVVGEMSLLTGKARSATVIAATQLDVVEIGQSDFAPLLTARPQIADQLSELLAQREAAQREGDDQTMGQDSGNSARASQLLQSIRQFFGLQRAGGPKVVAK